MPMINRISDPEPAAQADEGAPYPAPADDLRFRALLSPQAWAGLPAAVRRRFSKRLSGEVTTVYCGRIVEVRRSRAGWLLVQASRLIGGSLPTTCETGVPATVAVSEDTVAGGQTWTRIYGRRHGFPQVIHSAKRFRGLTGLEEYLGYGFGMALRVAAAGPALHFRSDHFFLQLPGLRVRFPHWMSPGHVTVSHIDRGQGTFAFVLRIDHPLLGELFRQTGLFADPGRRAP